MIISFKDGLKVQPENERDELLLFETIESFSYESAEIKARMNFKKNFQDAWRMSVPAFAFGSFIGKCASFQEVVEIGISQFKKEFKTPQIQKLLSSKEIRECKSKENL